MRELTQLIGRLALTTIVVLPAPRRYRAMQRQRILELSVAGNYSSEIKLSDEVKITAMVGTESSGWGGVLEGLEGWSAFIGKQWTLSEKKDHITTLELRAAKYAILTFTRFYPAAKTIHIKMDNIVAVSHLVKMGGTQNQLLVQISKEIWEYLLDKGIAVTAEYLPGALNKEAVMQS